MKNIELYTAALDNAGDRHEAGKTLSVGNGKTQIDADRAKTLTDNGGAVEKTDTSK